MLEQEGTLPPGITAGPGDPALNESTNDLALSGTIAEAGLWAFTVRLRDAQGLSVDRAFAVEAAVPPPPPPPEDTGCAAVGAPGDLGLALVFVGLAWAQVVRRSGRAQGRGRRQESSC